MPAEIINILVSLALGLFGGVVVALINNHFNRPAVKADAKDKNASAADTITSAAEKAVGLLEERFNQKLSDLQNKVDEMKTEYDQCKADYEKAMLDLKEHYEKEIGLLKKRLEELEKENHTLRTKSGGMVK